MARREENLNQIIRIDGNNCFMEALRNAFPIGKIQLNFFQYDKNREKGNKFTNEINIYLDFKDFDNIYYEIMHSGITIKDINAKALNPALKEYEKQVILHRGGSQSSENVNIIKARQLKIFKGRVKPIVLRAEIGKGQKNKQGGYTMVGSPERYVDIGMEYHDLERLLSEIHRALMAYEVERTLQPIIDRKFEEVNFEIKKLESMILLMLQSMPLNTNTENVIRAFNEIQSRVLPKPVPAYKQNQTNQESQIPPQNNQYQQQYPNMNNDNYQNGYYQNPEYYNYS